MTRLLPAIFLALAISGAAAGQTYTISTFAGGYLPANVTGTSANLDRPSKVAVDKSGNVFIADEEVD
jgi:hypothetical protein